jgi:transcriptional regulator with PAS, ATPase and Fis domain
VLEMIDAAAATDSVVLLRGESGTGKDLLARRLHRRSARAAGPYVRVNCAAVPTDMWESEFFGHRKGSFTGAGADRDGRFQLAHRGTLFLDEVGAMPPETQAKLLRVIQDGEVHRLGDRQPTRVDVRIVAATNADLEAAIREGRFRADLYYRLNVLSVALPPLRERIEDVELLARVFAEELAARLGRRAPELDAETLARLRAYPWPGNARELRSVIERALVLHPRRGLADLDLAPEPVGSAAGAAASAASSDLHLRDNLSRLERTLIVDAHRRSRGVRREAARLLGIDARNLAYYFRKHGLDPDAAGD